HPLVPPEPHAATISPTMAAGVEVSSSRGVFSASEIERGSNLVTVPGLSAHVTLSADGATQCGTSPPVFFDSESPSLWEPPSIPPERFVKCPCRYLLYLHRSPMLRRSYTAQQT